MQVIFTIESPSPKASAKAKAHFESLTPEQRKKSFDAILLTIEDCLNSAYRWQGEGEHGIAVQQLIHAARAVQQARSLHVREVPDWMLNGLVDLLSKVGKG